MYQSAGKIARVRRCHNFNLSLVPSHGAFQGTSTPADPSARNKKIAQRSTSLSVWFWLGRRIWDCGGRGWRHQCILSFIVTSLLLISLPHGVKLMWWRRVLRIFYLISRKRRLVRGLPCNRFMAWRQRIESAGVMKKATCLFCHQDKMRIWQQTIWPLSIALESKLMTKIILHQITSLHSSNNHKGSNIKVTGCGNKRALLALKRRKMFRIILHNFWNYTQEEVLKIRKIELFLVFLPVGYLNSILITDTNKVLNNPLDLAELMRWVGFWIYIACWAGIADRRDWWPYTLPVMHRGSPFWLNQYMSHQWFYEIPAYLRYTNREVHYEDGLLQMRQMEEARNKNMVDEFNPSRINVLENSMMEWYNKISPGFMCVGRKPHPFGNEHHAIYCGLT